MRLSDLVGCDCLALITFSDPDQAQQIAASDRSLQCLQDSVSNSIEKNAKFCYVVLA